MFEIFMYCVRQVARQLCAGLAVIGSQLRSGHTELACENTFDDKFTINIL